jgi:hypothetical protein
LHATVQQASHRLVRLLVAGRGRAEVDFDVDVLQLMLVGMKLLLGVVVVVVGEAHVIRCFGMAGTLLRCE